MVSVHFPTYYIKQWHAQCFVQRGENLKKGEEGRAGINNLMGVTQDFVTKSSFSI